ncbi:hypothetical protein [Carboxylicivirga sp. M1479]|uniref:hypothetical protein n=1 Tax=Carboxylicivirga sp. M1479 TaxID=2594476 RepID=UPI00117842A8|nr:hypothetical protein [Carboxylicivirga sp. M1479]TRX70751.1 hypothetical protein FNN09_09675 [Carboxylicivirga sp. M1479]
MGYFNIRYHPIGKSLLNGIFIDHLSQGSPFSFVDQKTPTNILGGIGRWTGLASRNHLIMHKKSSSIND